MEQGQVISLDGHIAANAAYYGHKYKLPLADSIIYAIAQKFDAVLWTQDADFENLKKVKYFPENIVNKALR